MYIKYKLSGSRNYDNYRHIVIDEAHDYGIFTFYVLKCLFKNATFSIYEDLAQSLYSYRSIDNWECLNDIYNNFDIVKLTKSYRTTIEIMNEANKINEILNLDKAIPVIRHGSEVSYKDNIDLVDTINELSKEFNTIAIITKDSNSSKNLYDRFKDKLDINLITSDNLNYSNNINILPSYLSKGLEFDAVIILDEFTKESIDLKLLYVSMTRALHKLYIVKNV